MPYKNLDIEKVLNHIEVHWKLKFCPKRRLNFNEYCISIELEGKKDNIHVYRLNNYLK